MFSLQQKLNIFKNSVTKKNPIYVQFYITSRCNLACEQCNIIYADAKHPEMNIDQINNVAQNLKQIGVNIVLLIGGEPFVRKDIHHIVKAFTSRGIHIRLQTNGLATEEQLENCLKAGSSDISISLDSLNEKTQDKINGGFKNSWNKALKTISKVSKIFPEGSSGFINSVIMPYNINDIEKVIKFSTKIGWYVSLVPIHTTTPSHPMPYRTIDYTGHMNFKKTDEPKIKELIKNLKNLKKNYNLYDSYEYLDDVKRFILKEPIIWRRKNNNVCDSPNLYFAIAPSGMMKACCDYELDKDFYVYDEKFVSNYKNGKIHEEVYKKTRSCEGCLYGSYPEVTITSRYLKHFIEKAVFFNFQKKKMFPIEYEEIIDIADEINKNE